MLVGDAGLYRLEVQQATSAPLIVHCLRLRRRSCTRRQRVARCIIDATGRGCGEELVDPPLSAIGRCVCIRGCDRMTVDEKLVARPLIGARDDLVSEIAIGRGIVAVVPARCGTRQRGPVQCVDNQRRRAGDHIEILHRLLIEERSYHRQRGGWSQAISGRTDASVRACAEPVIVVGMDQRFSAIAGHRQRRLRHPHIHKRQPAGEREFLVVPGSRAQRMREVIRGRFRDDRVESLETATVMVVHRFGVTIDRTAKTVGTTNTVTLRKTTHHRHRTGEVIVPRIAIAVGHRYRIQRHVTLTARNAQGQQRPVCGIAHAIGRLIDQARQNRQA